MNAEKQRIAIAELCGIFICPHCLHEIDPEQCHCGESMNHYPDGHSPVPMGCTCGYDDAPNRKASQPSCPDYLNDLNAMHEAEELTRKNQFHAVDYPHAVFKVITGLDWKGDMGYFFPMVIRATAADRAEALLKTIGKWVEK